MRFDSFFAFLGKLFGNDKIVNNMPNKSIPANPFVKGTNGKIESDAVVLKQDDNLVMVLDYDLGDMPAWIEWDTCTNLMSIAQVGGEVAQIAAIIPPEESSILNMFKRLILVTKIGEERVSHMVPFLIRS